MCPQGPRESQIYMKGSQLSELAGRYIAFLTAGEEALWPDLRVTMTRVLNKCPSDRSISGIGPQGQGLLRLIRPSLVWNLHGDIMRHNIISG